MERNAPLARILYRVVLAVFLFLLSAAPAMARRHPTQTAAPERSPNAQTIKKSGYEDDSSVATPAKDLLLGVDGQHKADALAHFVQGMAFEENGEMDKALGAYRKVLDLDPGEAELASRIAALLTRQDDFPQAIDVLKDAIKADPNASEPLLQLGYIYAKYLRRTDQAIDYVNRAIALNPRNIDAYERLCEIALAAGDEKKAIQSLDRAAEIRTDEPTFWTRLGKLYATVIFKPDRALQPNQISRLNEIFKKAAQHAADDPAVLKDVAEYYASTQQLQEAIPVYLRLLELEPDDTSAREKLATGFVLTNQRDKAMEMHAQLNKQNPEK